MACKMKRSGPGPGALAACAVALALSSPPAAVAAGATGYQTFDSGTGEWAAAAGAEAGTEGNGGCVQLSYEVVDDGEAVQAPVGAGAAQVPKTGDEGRGLVLAGSAAFAAGALASLARAKMQEAGEAV